MNISNIITIIRKEWAELYKNSLVLFTVLFLPLIFAAIPLIMLWAMGGYESSLEAVATEFPQQTAGLCEGLSGGECSQIILAGQFTILFMMIPLMIPATIAPYSIVGEKTQRSLEPLLATPISTSELLLGKNLSAVIPALLATWLAYAIYALGARFLVSSDLAFSRLFDIYTLISVFIVGPLLAILSVSFAIMISSRSNDPRAAQQITSLVILPVIMIFIAQLSGIHILSPGLVLGFVLALVVVDIILTYLSINVFERETILTRWA